MTFWGLASFEQQFAVKFLLFLILCTDLFYLLWTFQMKRWKQWWIVAGYCGLSFAVFLMLQDTDWLDQVPLTVLWVANWFSACGIGSAIFSGVRKSRNQVTRSSIKESMDNLPVAGCYFTENGTVKLCNRQMYRLYHDLTGSDLQSFQELHEALEACEEHQVQKTADGGFRFPDGRVWFYAEQRITAEDEKSYIESVFTDGTELAAANEELKKDNAELEQVNAKLQKMYTRAEDRIREREYLAFKMKMHDDIGRCLTVIRKVLQKELPDSDIEKQIRKLSVAAGTLVYSQKGNSDDPYDGLLAEAAELGVEVRLDGMLPVEPLIYELTVRAVKECVTNCVRHAHGTAVFVGITGLPGGYHITITNDGERPRGKITEGGGLSNLRKSVENAGGEMQIASIPEFTLQLTMLREEMEL